MNRKSLIFVLPLIALVLMACRVGDVNINRTVVSGSGHMVSEQRNVQNVERVTLRGSGDLSIVQGNEEGLTVEADENLMPYIETKMNGRELVIGFKGNNITIHNAGKVTYTLEVKTLNRIAVSGSGNVTADKLSVDDLGLDISGSGNVNFPDLQAKAVTTHTSGSGNFDLAGKVDTQDITITGAGNYNAGDLQSKEARTSINGAGNITVWTTDKLDAHITGFGTVNYYGKPSVSQSITGGGGVKSLGDQK